MKDNIKLSPAEEKELEESHKRFQEELKKQPEISDEDFMAEFEVSDEEYGIGLVLPGIGRSKDDGECVTVLEGITLRGELVPQDPNDEPGSVVLERIQPVGFNGGDE